MKIERREGKNKCVEEKKRGKKIKKHVDENKIKKTKLKLRNTNVIFSQYFHNKS